jgi:uncharacterized protein YuzE
MFQFGTTVLIRATLTSCEDEYIDAYIETVDGKVVIDQLESDDVVRIGLTADGYIWGILLGIEEDEEVAEVRLLTNHIDIQGWDHTILVFSTTQLENPSVLVSSLI